MNRIAGDAELYIGEYVYSNAHGIPTTLAGTWHLAPAPAPASAPPWAAFLSASCCCFSSLLNFPSELSLSLSLSLSFRLFLFLFPPSPFLLPPSSLHPKHDRQMGMGGHMCDVLRLTKFRPAGRSHPPPKLSLALWLDVPLCWLPCLSIEPPPG